MRKGMLILGAALVAVVIVFAAQHAYAADGEVNAWQGFWNSVGGFAYNAMPWNWGNWWGK